MTSVRDNFGFAALFGLLFSLSLYATDNGWVWYIPALTALPLFAYFAIARPGVLQGSTFFTKGIPLLAILFLAIPALAWSRSRFISMFELQSYVLLFGTLAAFSRLRSEDIKRCLYACTPLMAYLCYQGYDQVLHHKGFARAHFGDSNLFGGLVMAYTVALANGTWSDIRDARVSRGVAYVLWAVIAALLAAFLCTQSRSATLGALVSLALVSLALGANLRVHKKKVFLIGLGLVLVLGATVAYKTKNDLAQHAGFGASTNTRIAMWTSTLQMIRDNPVKGVGLGLWHVAYPKYRMAADVESAGFRAHNDYLEAMATGGPLGLLAMLAVPGLWVAALLKARRTPPQRRQLFFGLAIASGALCWQATVTFVFHQSAVCVLAGALIGALHALLAEDSPAQQVRNAGPRRVLALAVPLTFLWGCLTYVAVIPSVVIANPHSFEARHFSAFMTERVLLTIAEINPLCSSAYFALGHQAQVQAMSTTDVDLKKQEYRKAFAYYAQAERREPIQDSLSVRKAMIVSDYPGLASERRYELTEKYMKAALQENPAMFVAVKNYSAFLFRSGRSADALAVISRARQATPITQQKPLVALALQAKP